MRSQLIKFVVVGTSLLLMAVYFFMNQHKLETLSGNWADISTGEVASGIQLMLAGQPVFQQRLKDSEVFDKEGIRQIYFLHLPKSVFARTKAEIKVANLVIDQQDIALSSTSNKAALLAVTADKRVYLLEEGELKYMMTVIWNERLQAKKFMRCVTKGLCDSISITSNHWGPMQGPFLDSDIIPGRRGMPKGRWVMGPRTAFDIQSAKQQKVLVQINLLSEFPDQELSLRGAVAPLRNVSTNPDSLEAGGRSLYPGVYLVPLNLQPGANRLEMAFSKWSKPVSEGANSMAAYVTAVGLKQAD